jgi:hypothetical protein
MLVAMFNAVKVESVPLKSEFFPAARRFGVGAIIGEAWPMGTGARMGRFIAGGALAAALAIVAASMVITARPAPAATDEDQVRAVLEGMNGSYNRSDFGAFASHVCADMLRAGDYEAGWYQSRTSDGPTEITINSIDVTGDDAVANVRFVAANHSDAKTLDVDFLREDDDWKACRYDASQPV